MKILFSPIMPHIKEENANMASDYQSDMLFHGLVKRLGKDVHVTHNLWWHHEDKKKENPQLFNEIWGSGFTMYGLLDRKEYTQAHGNYNLNFLSGSYDAVVMPIHHTMNKQDQHLEMAIKFFVERGYEKNQIIVVDGWDQEYINKEIAESCTYYKREMKDHHEEYAHPISFAFPKEKIREIDDSKRNLAFAPLIPVNQSIDPSYMSTYKYDTEKKYYDMYQTAYFSYTSKKGGWDTLRHYEIIANGSIPFFVDIENCPKHTLWNLPKETLLQARKMLGGRPNLTKGVWKGQTLPHCGVINKDEPGGLEDFHKGLWQHFRDKIYLWLYEEATTEALASYVLGKI
jgi:hypothetical protein